MSAGLGKCSKIRHIVRLGQMLQRWRNKARIFADCIPVDVPAGHVAVNVRTSCRRFVVRLTYLNHPVFKKLLSQVEEEYVFSNQGSLLIPCNESLFEEVIRFRFESLHSVRKHRGLQRVLPFVDRISILHLCFMGSLSKQSSNSGKPERKRALILS